MKELQFDISFNAMENKFFLSCDNVQLDITSLAISVIPVWMEGITGPLEIDDFKRKFISSDNKTYEVQLTRIK